MFEKTMKKNKKAVVFVSLKDGVLDPQGQTIRKALGQMGYHEIVAVRSGRFFELEIDPSAPDIETRVEEVCAKLLANPVIEDYRVEQED